MALSSRHVEYRTSAPERGAEETPMMDMGRKQRPCAASHRSRVRLTEWASCPTYRAPGDSLPSQIICVGEDDLLRVERLIIACRCI